MDTRVLRPPETRGLEREMVMGKHNQGGWAGKTGGTGGL